MHSMTSDATSRTVLVTGAAGFIGLPVVRRLRTQGFRVVAVDDGSAGTLNRLDEFVGCADVRLRVLWPRCTSSPTATHRLAKP